MGFGSKIGDWIYEITGPFEKAFKSIGRILCKAIWRLIVPAFFGALAWIAYPGDIFETPFAQLTLKAIGGLIAFVFFGFLALRSLFRFDE